jgi:outer membrane protein TolC
MRLIALLILAATASIAEVRTLTPQQVVQLALTQNPDILIARLEAQRADALAREARDPFIPKLFAGSGLAYTSGFPMSIEGSAPSVLQARAVQTLYNPQLSYEAAASREGARGAAIDADIRREEVVHRLLLLHLSAARSDRIVELVRQQVTSFQSIADAVRARVEEGRELPVEARAAELRLAQTRQRLRALESEHDQLQASLAIALGMSPEDRVRAVMDEQIRMDLPDSEANAVEEALANSKRLRRLESSLQAKQLQVRGARSSRYPQIDLVAQYALMAKFNNYEEFFQRFQRNNWQIGMSFQIPIVPGAANSARESQYGTEMAQLRTQINSLRNQITVDTRKIWQDVQNATAAREVAKMDLDVTRERLSVALAQFEEGRGSLRQVEELRSAEADKWLAFYDAQQAVERGRLDLVRQTGTILAAVH